MNGAPTGRVTPSTVTADSSITSSSADWVFGDARLISSASTMEAKTGPGWNSSAPMLSPVSSYRSPARPRGAGAPRTAGRSAPAGSRRAYPPVPRRCLRRPRRTDRRTGPRWPPRAAPVPAGRCSATGPPWTLRKLAAQNCPYSQEGIFAVPTGPTAGVRNHFWSVVRYQVVSGVHGNGAGFPAGNCGYCSDFAIHTTLTFAGATTQSPVQFLSVSHSPPYGLTAPQVPSSGARAIVGSEYTVAVLTEADTPALHSSGPVTQYCTVTVIFLW